MRLGSAVVGLTVGLAMSATVSYAVVQEFTLDEARTRIERLEARVSSLETTITASTDGTPEASVTHTVSGLVVIGSSQNVFVDAHAPFHAGDPCFGEDGDDDFREGASVRALDESGTIVGSTRLNTGALIRPGRAPGCELSWTMEVEDADFYVFEVANHDGPSFSRADLEANNWTVALTW